jgi:ribosome modulation factor
MIETVEQATTWYWQGFDAFSKMDVPICPYADGDAKRQWWLGYDDAEVEHAQL